jgi:hypothetical protein
MGIPFEVSADHRFLTQQPAQVAHWGVMHPNLNSHTLVADSVWDRLTAGR